MTTSITFPNITTTFKTAMYEVLSSYFNGAVHKLNDVNITFNSAKIVFDIHAIDPKQLTIALLGDVITSTEELKCRNPRGNSPGIELHSEILRSIAIGSPQSGGTPSNRLVVDQTWDMLFAVINGARKTFADRGILQARMSPIPQDITEKDTIITAYGALTCRLRCQFARHNLT